MLRASCPNPQEKAVFPLTTTKEFPFRLASIDLDDTLLSPDKTISAENLAAIRALQARGVRILLASGRRHENMLKYHVELELEGAIVSCQGALSRIAETGEILHRQTMPADLASRIVRDGEQRGVTQIYYHLDGTYVTEFNEWTELYDSRTHTAVEKVESLHQFDDTEPLKILWVCDAEYNQAQFNPILAHYGDALELVITDPEYLEFMRAGVTKSLGIAATAAYYGIEQSQVLAFGDGNNEVTMLQWAGLGVAMDHARDSAKAAADRIAPEGPPQSSFARAVNQILSEY